MNRQLKIWLLAALAALVALGLVACGGGADRTKANLRLVNASSGYAALDLVVDDKTRLSSVGYGQGASYVEVDPSNMTTSITQPASATPLVTLTPKVVKQNFYTLLAYGVEGSLKTVLLDDNEAEPDSGKTRLRVVNAAPDAGPVDVYLTAAGDPLAGAVALQAGVAVGSAAGFVTVNSGTWQLRVTGPGAKADVRLDVGGLVLASKDAVTIVVTPASGGVLVNALVLQQEGALTAFAGTQARVRVASGLEDGGAVTAVVESATPINAVAGPAVSDYVLVPGGSQIFTVGVDGATRVSSQYPFASGHDYTLLVRGPAAAPLAVWLTDDNRLPATAAKAKLRVVHGLGGSTGALSMTADGLPVASGVAAGAASAYTEVAPGTTVALSVSADGVPTPIFNAADRVLAAGGVYTVFMLGAPSPAVGVLRQDR